MGKCYFDPKWLEESDYKDWLRDGGDRENFRCCFCNQTYKIGKSGKKAFSVHMSSQKHRAAGSSKTLLGFARKTPCVREQQQSPVPSTVNSVSDSRSSSETITSNFSSVHVSDNASLKAEIKWVLHLIKSHSSARSSDDTDSLFSSMFPDSNIAKKFQCSRTKVGYLSAYGISPAIRKEIIKTVKDSDYYVLMFDESLNPDLQTKQLDVHIRFLDVDGQVKTRYVDSYFLGHAKASDILSKLTPLIEDLGSQKLVQLSMDGPNVNWKVFKDLSAELEKDHGQSLLNIGSCGLHVLHNSFRDGVAESSWDIQNFLRALYNLFQESPARREDFAKVTECSLLPLKFCGHRWLENVPAAERAVAMMPSIMQYVASAKRGEVNEPLCKSFKVIAEYEQDRLLLPKLQSFIFVAKMFLPFLTKFQKDEPLAPYLVKDLFSLVKRLYILILKPEEVQLFTKPTDLPLPKDIENKDFRHHSKIDVGHQAEKTLDKEKKKLSELQLMTFRKNFQKMICKMITKVMDKSPLKHKLAHHIACLDPSVGLEEAVSSFRKLASQLNKQGWLSDGEVDDAIYQFQVLREAIGPLSSISMGERLDEFYKMNGNMDGLPVVKKIVNILLILSHGNAEVERGFSVNKEVTVENLHEETLIARRLICQYMVGKKVAQVHLSPDMMKSCSRAWGQYQEALEEKKKMAKESEQKKQRKRKADEVKELQSKTKKVKLDIDMLINTADNICEEAESEPSKEVHSLLVKANALRKDAKEKKKELAILTSQLQEKEEELKSF